MLRPDLDIPHKTYIRTHLKSLYESVQSKLLSDLPETAKVSIALDGWQSLFKRSFLAVTAYYITTDWQWQEVRYILLSNYINVNIYRRHWLVLNHWRVPILVNIWQAFYIKSWSALVLQSDFYVSRQIMLEIMERCERNLRSCSIAWMLIIIGAVILRRFHAWLM